MAVSTFFIIMAGCYLLGLFTGLLMRPAWRTLQQLWCELRWVRPLIKPYKPLS